MHKLESLLLDNETQKIHLHVEIQTDQPVPARRLNLVMINKKKKRWGGGHLPSCVLCRLGGPQSEYQRKQKVR